MSFKEVATQVEWKVAPPEFVVREVNSDGTAVANSSNLDWWYEEMVGRHEKDVKRFEDHHGSSEQMFSLWLYYWMINHESLGTEQLESRLYVDGMTYLAERVFELPYNELKLRYTNEDIYGEGFGDKGLLDICRDGVDLKKAAKELIDRPLHEGLGAWNLLHLLPTMQIGEVAMLISPPDPNDPSMGEYNLIYLYEKVTESSIGMGIVTDYSHKIDYWQQSAESFSKYSNDFSRHDHNEFVAHPFITNLSLSEIKSRLLLGESKNIPDWALDKLRSIIPNIREALYRGDIKRAEELFNGFKIATTAKLLKKEKEIDVVRLVDDREYFSRIAGWYMDNGGDKFLDKRTGCSLDRIDLGKNSLFGNQRDYLSRFDMGLPSSDSRTGSEKSTTSDGDIVITLPDGTTYVLTIRDGWKCNSEGCGRVSNHESKVRIGECHICEYCDPNVHKAG